MTSEEAANRPADQVKEEAYAPGAAPESANPPSANPAIPRGTLEANPNISPEAPSTIAVAKPKIPSPRNFTLRLGELTIFLAAVMGAVALGLGISSYFVAHPYVMAYLAAYGAFRFADLLVREDATLWTDREGFARRIAYQLPILLLFASAPFERTYIYGAEAPQWSAGLGLLIELAGLWLALGARIQLGFFSPAPHVGGDSKLVRGGLYRYIRHPIYLGEMLVLMAWPFEYGAPFAEALMVIIGVIVLRRRIRYEEAELLAVYGDDYAHYMRETDRILPNVW
ncbi:MAG TPA: isoprenylcysteine carboxylmethyltransferase family protein [Candidatus Binataceae bacterium]|nr:isoprenylcysteine carboxylmethyltransferase family protein [Candidatus Binataceae bacterium]